MNILTHSTTMLIFSNSQIELTKRMRTARTLRKRKMVNRMMKINEW